jgi:hypothetical protein
MIAYLIFLAVFSLIVLIVGFLNIRASLKNGREIKFVRVRALFSWLLVFIFVGSIGGTIYLSVHDSELPSKTTGSAKTQKTISKASTSKTGPNLKVTYSPNEPIIYNDSVEVSFKVPAKAKLEIVAHFSGLTYKTFTNHTNKTKYFKFNFDEASTFDLVVTRNGHKKTQKITIEKANGGQSNQTATSTVSSYSSSSSYEQASSQPTTDNTQSSNTATTGTNNAQ